MINRNIGIAQIARAGGKLAIFGVKLAITCGCFWYLFRQVNAEEILRETANLDYRWFIAAAITVTAQMPLVALRWSWITNALEPQRPPVPIGAILAITMIANFVAQILPNVVGDAVRVWMLSKIRTGWSKGLIGVVIDRGTGVGVLLVIGFVTLLSASEFTAFAGFRKILLLVFGALLLAASIGLICARFFAPILTRYRITSWVGELILASRLVLMEFPCCDFDRCRNLHRTLSQHRRHLGTWQIIRDVTKRFGGCRAVHSDARGCGRSDICERVGIA